MCDNVEVVTLSHILLLPRNGKFNPFCRYTYRYSYHQSFLWARYDPENDAHRDA